MVSIFCRTTLRMLFKLILLCLLEVLIITQELLVSLMVRLEAATLLLVMDHLIKLDGAIGIFSTQSSS